MKTVAQLEDELARAKEELRWIRDSMKPDELAVFHGVKISRSERIILHALETTEGRVSNKNLRRRLDVVLECIDESSLKSVDVAVCHLRKKLRALNPPIEIENEYGGWFFLDDVNKKRVAELRR